MKKLLLSTLLVFLCVANIRAQGQEKAVIFTGVVTDPKNDSPLPNAYIFNVRAGRGTITNAVGYFILPVYPGDSIVFSYVGFKRQYHIIPRKIEQTYSAVIELREDNKLLQEVKVYPFRNEEEFKQAFLNLKLPDEKEREALAKNMNPLSLEQMGVLMGNSPSANYRGFIDQQVMASYNKNALTMIPFLNPFAWANFIKSVKHGDLKNDKWKSMPIPIDNVSRDKFIRQQGN